MKNRYAIGWAVRSDGEKHREERHYDPLGVAAFLAISLGVAAIIGLFVWEITTGGHTAREECRHGHSVVPYVMPAPEARGAAVVGRLMDGDVPGAIGTATFNERAGDWED